MTTIFPLFPRFLFLSFSSVPLKCKDAKAQPYLLFIFPDGTISLYQDSGQRWSMMMKRFGVDIALVTVNAKFLSKLHQSLRHI